MGRHEPPSKRSFYFSLATSTLRFAIVVALVVGGIWVINSAFPEADGGGALPDGAVTTGPTAATGPSGATGPTGETGPTEPQEPDLSGVPLAVRNGTSVSGLASDTAAKLEEDYGMDAIQIDDAPDTVAITTIYYRSADLQDDAEFLAQDFFKKIDPRVAKLQPGEGVERDVEIAIYLGTDYASTKT
jgi:hypothetical protein